MFMYLLYTFYCMTSKKHLSYHMYLHPVLPITLHRENVHQVIQICLMFKIKYLCSNQRQTNSIVYILDSYQRSISFTACQGIADQQGHAVKRQMKSPGQSFKIFKFPLTLLESRPKRKSNTCRYSGFRMADTKQIFHHDSVYMTLERQLFDIKFLSKL